MKNTEHFFFICLLRWFCPEELLEEIEGDLFQKFNKDEKKFGETKARRRLAWNVIRFFRPGIILRNKISINFNAMYMLSNYFKVASRVMLRNKSFSLINIFGLTLGLTGAMLLFLWIANEMSYDQFHADKERIFTVWNSDTQRGETACWSYTPRVLAPTLKNNFTAVESVTSYGAYGTPFLFGAGEKKLVNKSGVFVDSDFLTMLSFPLIRGDASTALLNPSSIVITEKFAKQLFGDREAFGEVLSLSAEGNDFTFEVSGVLKELPGNTDFRFDYLLPWKFLEEIYGEDTFWGNNSVVTLVKIRQGITPDQFSEQIRDVKKKYGGEETTELFLHPLTKNRLYSGFVNGVQAGGRIEIIRMLGLLGLCLIVIAGINYVNLSTARAQKRSREVGIRKVTGAYRHSLIVQFLCESVLIAFIAGVVSLGIVYLALPAFNSLIKQTLELSFTNITFWAGLAGIILFMGVLAGGYPALYLSSFHPARILKGATITTGRRNMLRQVLVVFQFGFAVTLIVSVIVISKQISFVQHRDAGYVKNNLIYQEITGDLEKNYLAYRNELIASGLATSVTKTSARITDRWSNTTSMNWRGKDPIDKTPVERIYVDENISATAGITILEGRDMDLSRFPTDSTAVLLNETAVKLMGFDEPIGEIIEDNDIEWHVIGVVNDFILTSPFQKVTPIVLQGGKKQMFGVIHIRFNADKPIQENIAGLAALSSKYNPAYPFEYHFIDEEYERKFSDIKTTLKITSLFGSMAIIIACLGLLGLSTFMIESRVKEIGIRKVLGSSVAGIVKLLSVDSVKPIVVAIVLFTPLAWMAMRWWLQSFDYRIELQWWIFALSGVLIVLIALLTIGVQTTRAARTNPVSSLRSE